VALDGTIFKVNTSSSDYKTIEVLKGQQTILTFTDSQYSEDIFIRKIDKFTYYIRNKEIILKIKELKTEFLTKLEPKHLSEDPKVITFDIETVTDKLGIMKAYLYSMYNGKDKIY
jgi:RecA-family ATPase